jgi:TM2 domain-containing membrane protein YozV
MTDQNPYDPSQQPPVPPPPPGYGQGYPAPPGYDPAAPYGRDPFGRPLSNKSKLVAGLLNILLGFGIGRLYAGQIGIGLAQMFTCGGLFVWSFVDGVLFLVKDDRTDGKGLVLRG